MESSKFGKYHVVEKIGEGGFGEVFKGRDPTLKRFVAIKTCKAARQEFLDRFLLEAEISAGLQHPNIVTIYDFGYQEETPYLVQEYLTGQDLDRKIRDRAALDFSSKAEILRQAAIGLRHAHHRGIVHRDIKPANLRVLEDERVKIMDFGIAKLLSSEIELTQTGMTMGTARYQAPEQFQGDKVDLRADIFSFGVTIYELLTYERPFDGDSVARIFYRITHEQPRPIRELWPECPEGLQRCIDNCLHKEPAHRYSDLAPVIGVLEAFCAPVGSGSYPMAAMPPPPPPPAPLSGARPTGESAPPGKPGPQGATVALETGDSADSGLASRVHETAAALQRSPSVRTAAFIVVALVAFALTFAAGKLLLDGKDPGEGGDTGDSPPPPSTSSGPPSMDAQTEDLPSPEASSTDDSGPATTLADAADQDPPLSTAVIVEPAAPVRRPIVRDGGDSGAEPVPRPQPVPPPSVASPPSNPPASGDQEPPPDLVAEEPSPPPPSPPPQVATGSRGMVVLYQSRDFGGQGESFQAADASLVDNPIGNDSVRSVQVDVGCRVELYEDVDYGGRKTVLTGHRGNLRGTEVGNSEVSSLRVTCQPTAAPGRGAVLYVHGDFRGPSEFFSGDDSNLADNPIGDDTVSSVRVSPGCRVRLFRKANYQSRETTLVADVAGLDDTEVGNDEVSSVRVECRSDPR